MFIVANDIQTVLFGFKKNIWWPGDVLSESFCVISNQMRKLEGLQLCILQFSWKSHLDQKYDQEVEVSDSSELLEQVLGNEVPEGILSDTRTAKLLSTRLLSTRLLEDNGQTMTILLSRETVYNGHKNNEMCHSLKTWTLKEITWLSEYEIKE